MKIKLDENLPEEASIVLGNAGHDVSTVRKQGLSGRPDSDVIGICAQEGRALITLDLDFANVRAYPPEDYHGIVVLRLDHQDKANVLAVAARLLDPLEEEPLTGRLWVVDERRIRIRPGNV
jgi:predicted nuclease of predicted toxin-antitoxin system